MSGIRDTATVTLNVNGAQAKQFMADLEKQIQDTEAAIVDMQKKMAAPKDIEKAKKQLKTYKKQLDEMRSATEGVNRALENIELATPRELEKALRTLNRQLKDMVPGSEVWDSHIEKIRELKARLADLKGEVNEQQSAWARFKEWSVSAWPAIDLLRQGYDALIGGMREYVDAYAEMDQEMANVRKFTGMTEGQVASLNEELKKIDTRTSREELNKLAQEAGRLGKTSEEDVLGFVRAADKINVALDDLGEGATLTLSKLTGIFGDEARYGTEQSLLKVGSVINELSQNCSASAPYLANFAERMGGVGSQAKMTISQIMGFGAVLDANAQKVEASATALSQIIVRLYQDPAKYAKVAGLDAKEFATLMRKDANSALLLFLETLQKAGGMDQLSPMFKDMGENGSRAIAALSTLATHIDQVKAQQAAANAAFREGTSIDNEFAVQNNTVQAALEKCKNRANELRVELGEKLYPLMQHLITTGSAALKGLNVLTDFIIKNRVGILSLVVVIGSYYTWMGLCKVATVAYTAAVKACTAVHGALRISFMMAKIAAMALTGNITKATHAFKLLNAVVKANPFGLLLSVVTAVGVAIYHLCNRTSELTKKMREAKNTAATFSEEFQKEMRNIGELVGKLEALEKGTKEYKSVKDQIISQYGQYLNGLIDEKGEINNLTEAYSRLSAAARIAAKERAIQTAKDTADEAYNDAFKANAKKLQELLLAEGADPRAAARLTTQVITQLQTTGTLTSDVVAALESYKGSYQQAWGMVEHPNNVVNDMIGQQTEYNITMEEIGKIEDETNPLAKYSAAELRMLIEDYEPKVAAGEGGRIIIGIDQPNPTIKDLSATELRDFLDEARARLSVLESPTTNGVVDWPIDDGGDGDQDPTPTPDRFAAEKAWRQRQEAEARIAYAKGQTDYAEHTERMDEIAADYYQKLLDRTDVFGDEELSIRAQYYEAVNKHTKSANQLLINAENESYADLLSKLEYSLLQQLSVENLSAAEREKAEKTYREAVELAELNHLATLIDMYEEGSAERLKAEQSYQTARLKAQRRHQEEYEKQEAKYAKIKADFFGDNPQERQEKYDTAFDALKIVYERELAAAGDNAAEKLRIEEAFLQAQNELRRQYGLESEEDTRNSMQRAVDASVEWLNSDGGKAVTGSLSTLSSGMSSIFSGLSTMMQAELEIQTAQIEKRYDREISLAQGNSYKVAKLEKKKEAEIAKAKNDANKKMFAMQVIQAVAQTAQNALNAYGSAAAIPVVGYILAPVAAAMAVAAGAIQIAAIKKQQQASEAQGYSAGGFTKPGRVDEPAGIVHAGEWVASQKLLANPVARPMIEALDYAQRTNTIGSLRAEDVSRSITAPQSVSRLMEDNRTAAIIASALTRSAEAVENLNDRLNEPIVADVSVTGERGINQASEYYKQLIKNKSKR